MQAIGDWVVLIKDETTSESGIVSINDNMALVHDCQYDGDINGKKVVYNAEGSHFTHNEFIIVRWSDIMAVME